MLDQCSACNGFLPSGHTACPNCGPQPAADGVVRSVAKRVVASATGGLVAMTLMACYGSAYVPIEARPVEAQPPRPACEPGQADADRDGSCTPADCNDTDASVYPGAPDSAGDGIDQSCDGEDGMKQIPVVP